MIRFSKNEHKKTLILLSDFIRKISKGDRTKRLSKKVELLIKKEALKKKTKVSVIDFGCGSMEISKKIQHNTFIKKIIGLDIYKSNYQYKKLQYHNYKNLNDLSNFRSDVVILVDVLHHIGVDKSHLVLKRLSKNSKTLIIKDHFEHGYFSRQLLRFIDFYANYAYGVKIPKKYFDYNSWKKTVKKSNLTEEYFEKKFQQHDGLFNLILNKKHHFISVLKNS
tara:strand:+ start:725 stop:1390 length:666 start_codon:yes stop_codon:yes gene_type:complete